LGIIDSLSAGFRSLVRRLDLLLIPILLDLWLWFMPPLSIASLLEQLSGFYARATDVEGFPPELVEMSSEVSLSITMLGENSNLWTLLANTWLMHVPSMMATMGPMPGAVPTNIDSLASAVGLTIVLSLAGIFIGTFYLELLVRFLPIGNGQKAQTWREFVSNVLRHSGRILGFVLVVGIGMLLAYIPLSFGVGIVALLSPPASSVLVILLGGATLVVFFYLFFVVPAIVMDDLTIFSAIKQSFSLVRSSFAVTLGFVFLTSFISIGFSLLLLPLAEMVPAGTIVAIVINSFLGTGLAVALFVFYRTRILLMVEETTVLDRQP
jgi:hypothetical protein